MGWGVCNIMTINCFSCHTCTNEKCKYLKQKDYSASSMNRDHNEQMSPSVFTSEMGCLLHSEVVSIFRNASK